MATAMGNRVTAAIARCEARIQAMGGIAKDGSRLDDLHAKNRLALDEFVAYQNTQALAHATGKISSDEAATVYGALGGESYHGDWPKGTSLAVKMVVTQLMGDLLGVTK